VQSVDFARKMCGVTACGDASQVPANTGGQTVVLDQAGLQRLVAELIERGYHVIGPTLRDNAIVLAELESADDLPRGWGANVAPGPLPGAPPRRQRGVRALGRSPVLEAVPAARCGLSLDTLAANARARL
jgi:hypothetical protein